MIRLPEPTADALPIVCALACTLAFIVVNRLTAAAPVVTAVTTPANTAARSARYVADTPAR